MDETDITMIRRIIQLQDALRPLAGLDLRPDSLDKRLDTHVVYARDRSQITVGDVRRARKALAFSRRLPLLDTAHVVAILAEALVEDRHIDFRKDPKTTVANAVGDACEALGIDCPNTYGDMDAYGELFNAAWNLIAERDARS